jgi:lipopolysaccharide transport system permease protein
MLQIWRSLIKHHDLLLMITWRDIRIKYKQSIMGFLWAVLMPIIIVAAGMVIKLAFSYLSGKPVDKSQFASIAVKSVPWAFFVSSIRFSSTSLIANNNLVTKIYFPRIIFPVSAVISQLFDFAIATTLLVVILSVIGIGVSAQLAWVPVLVTILVILVLGLGIFLAAANLFFRDVKYIVEVILTFAIFFTPVFYEVEMFDKWKTLLMLNPVAPILEGLRSAVVLHQTPDPLWTAYSAAIAMLGLAFSVSSFARMEPLFAENI